MGNLAGTVAVLSVLFKPSTVLPHLAVRDIRQLDWARLYTLGFRGCVFDKDNCLTHPHSDELVPDLRESWAECLRTFGASNVLIVSNSAGTADDPGLIQAESVARKLGVSVLSHSNKKPGWGCANQISGYFSSDRPTLAMSASLPLPKSRGTPSIKTDTASILPHHLLVVGDRTMTDVLLSSRLGACSVWTTGVWKREGAVNDLLRRAEVGLVRWLRKKGYAPSDGRGDGARLLRQAGSDMERVNERAADMGGGRSVRTDDEVSLGAWNEEAERLGIVRPPVNVFPSTSKRTGRPSGSAETFTTMTSLNEEQEFPFTHERLPSAHRDSVVRLLAGYSFLGRQTSPMTRRLSDAACLVREGLDEGVRMDLTVMKAKDSRGGPQADLLPWWWKVQEGRRARRREVEEIEREGGVKAG